MEIIEGEPSSCKGKSSWPEVVGSRGEDASAIIERENPLVKAVIVLIGTVVTTDYNCHRVWVWVDKKGAVVKVPRIG